MFLILHNVGNLPARDRPFSVLKYLPSADFSHPSEHMKYGDILSPDDSFFE
jgi:hypothetical protein